MTGEVSDARARVPFAGLKPRLANKRLRKRMDGCQPQQCQAKKRRAKATARVPGRRLNMATKTMKKRAAKQRAGDLISAKATMRLPAPKPESGEKPHMKAKIRLPDSNTQPGDRRNAKAKKVLPGQSSRGENHRAKGEPTAAATGEANGGEERGVNDTMSAAIASIRELHIQRQATIRILIGLNNQTLALIRRVLGFQTGADERERKRICDQAEAMVKAVEGGDPTGEADCNHATLAPFIITAREARAPFEARRKEYEKRLAELVRTLPVWSWCETVRGFAEGGLAGVVGEAGDLNNYSHPDKLAKRFGLAPFQGKCPSTWRRFGGLHSEQWEHVGYSPNRRSIMWNIGDVLIKSNRDGKYRTMYLAEKEKQQANNPDMTKMHAHRRAQIKMEHEFIRDLWRAWRGA